ncbi:Clr5 domain-containing protein, partial [Chaetomium fimeti]
MALQSEASAAASSPTLKELVESLRAQASRTPDTSHVQPDHSQDAVSAVERPSERPMVPTSRTDWESKKKTIQELYMDQNMVLNDVIDIMITKYRFKATARMYKGQFAKWKWTKYNKSGKPGSIKTTRSRVVKRKTTTARKPAARADGMWELMPTQAQHLVSLSQHAHLQYLTDEDCRVETTLSAYAALISHWSELETPWRTDSDQKPNFSELFQPRGYSILQHVRSAYDFFQAGQPQQGGDMLRRAFLGIESAVENGIDMEALWDCCLAVPHLVLVTGWTDMLAIFARYLHQYTTIKLQSH